MFFAKTLKEKLESTLKEYLDKNQDCLFPYKFSKNNNTTLLAELKNNNPEYTHDQLKEMSKKDYLSNFTKKNLHKKWERKCKVNYSFTTHKLSQKLPEKILESKEYIKNFVDKDIFELKPQKWNNSTKSDNKMDMKTYIKSLKNEADFYPKKIGKRKNNKIYNYQDIIHNDLNSGWNVSSKLEQKEKDNLDKKLILDSMNNTQKFWMKKRLNRDNVDNNYNSTLLNMKNLIMPMTHYKNKLIEERKNNSNIIISKQKLKNHWKDKELSEKIKLIKDWDESFFNPELNNKYTPEDLKKEILKKIIYNKSKIETEQKKLKEEKYFNDKIKKGKLSKNKTASSSLYYSKYPLIINQKNNFEKNNDINIINNEENKTFIQACQNVILEQKNKNNIKRCLSCKNINLRKNDKIIKYKHPGVYREFVYKIHYYEIENEGENDDNNENKENQEINKEEKYMAWSCCNNTDKNSKGCQKYIVNAYNLHNSFLSTNKNSIK